jgi:3'-5' exoribonuclease
VKYLDKQWINTLAAGDRVETVLGVHEISLARYNRPNRAGEQYLRMVVGDRTGTLEARIWDTDLALQVFHGVKTEDLVFVTGTVQEFNGLQLNVATCRIIAWDSVDPADFRPMVDRSLSQLWQAFYCLADQIQSQYWARLLDIIWTEDFKQTFAAAPAGRQVHHNYGGGLLEHTVEVMEYCRLAYQLQGSGMDRELLLVGAMLHDVGKVVEYDLNSLTFRLSEQGKLLGGHIILGRDMVRIWIGQVDDFPADQARALEHMILSHHGVPEWGSPVAPKTMEAICLHQADLLSARINQAYRIVSAPKGGDAAWSAYDRYLGRSLLIPNDLQTEETEGRE